MIEEVGRFGIRLSLNAVHHPTLVNMDAQRNLPAIALHILRQQSGIDHNSAIGHHSQRVVVGSQGSRRSLHVVPTVLRGSAITQIEAKQLAVAHNSSSRKKQQHNHKRHQRDYKVLVSTVFHFIYIKLNYSVYQIVLFGHAKITKKEE